MNKHKVPDMNFQFTERIFQPRMDIIFGGAVSGMPVASRRIVFQVRSHPKSAKWSGYKYRSRSTQAGWQAAADALASTIAGISNVWWGGK